MDSFCLILIVCQAVIMSAVVITVAASHRQKLVEMERIALDLAKENAKLREEVKREVSLP